MKQESRWSIQKKRGQIFNVCKRVFVASFVFLATSQQTFANPTNGSVTAGSATITNTVTETNINQTSNRAIIEWGSFDVDVGQSVNFVQPNSGSVTLNRVVNNSQVSLINGNVNANGKIIIINPNGILIGPNGKIDTSGLLVTSADVNSDNSFMNSNGLFNFNKPGKLDALVENKGQITINNAGLGALVAPNVKNSGLIQGNLSKIQLASADTFTIDLYGDGLLQLAVQKPKKNTERNLLVENTGAIMVGQGTVILTTAAVENLVNSVINNAGVVEASNLHTDEDGNVILGESEDQPEDSPGQDNNNDFDGNHPGGGQSDESHGANSDGDEGHGPKNNDDDEEEETPPADDPPVDEEQPPQNNEDNPGQDNNNDHDGNNPGDGQSDEDHGNNNDGDEGRGPDEEQDDNGHHHCGGNRGAGIGNECVPDVEPPPVDDPPTEEPPVEDPPTEEPPPPPDEPPVVDDPPVDEEQPPSEEPPTEEPPVDNPPVDDPPVDPTPDVPPVDEEPTPEPEQPPVETPPVDNPPVDEEPPYEEPPVESSPEPIFYQMPDIKELGRPIISCANIEIVYDESFEPYNISLNASGFVANTDNEYLEHLLSNSPCE